MEEVGRKTLCTTESTMMMMTTDDDDDDDVFCVRSVTYQNGPSPDRGAWSSVWL